MKSLSNYKVEWGNQEKAPYALLFLMMLVYFLFFTMLSINKHNRFGTSGFDLGIHDQANWLLSQGETAFITVRGLHIFADHASYIHILSSRIFWLWDDVRALLILQTFAFAISAVPLYFLAKDILKNKWIPLAVVLSFYLYPALHHINLWHYHPESMGVPFVLFAFYFATKKRFSLYFLFVFLMLTTKEEFSLTVMLLGIYVAIKHDKKVGFITSLSSIIWILIVLKVLLPHFNQTGYIYFSEGIFGKFGRTPSQIIWNFLTHPLQVLSIIFEEINRKYLFNLFAPIGFLAILSPYTLAIASFALLTNLVSDFHYTHLFNHHYTTIIIPFIFISVIYGISKIENKIYLKTSILILLLASFLGNLYLGPYETNIKNSENIIFNLKNFGKPTSDYESNVIEALNLIPEQASVSSTPFFVPQLTHRKEIYEFPNPFMQVNWGMFDDNPPPKGVEYILANTNPFVEEEKFIIDLLLDEGLYVKIFEKGGIIVLKKDYGGDLDAIYERLKIQMDPKIKDLALARKNYPTCDKIVTLRTKEECYKEVGIVTNDYNLCDVRIKNLSLRDECFNKIGIKSNNYNLCAVKIKSQALRDECFKDVSIATGDLNLCLTRVESEDLKAECNEAIRQLFSAEH